MSDHDAAPDPMDQAYARAETLLNDEAARAARRARVLAAVAGEAAAPSPVEPASPARRSAWGRGGWLAAAGVAGLGVFLATRVYLPATIPQKVAPPPATTGGPAAPASEPAAAAPPPIARKPTPAAKAPTRTSRPAPSKLAAARATATPSSSDVAEAPPRPAPPAPSVATASRAALSAAAPATAPARSSEINELVVTAERIQAPASSEPAAKLRAAAAAGRTAELTLLLAKGVPVDAADDAGETALMKAVQADHPTAAALLRRRGASLDLRNHAGLSARDVAASIGDAKLNEALGLGP
jgi:hypothetical protein